MKTIVLLGLIAVLSSYQPTTVAKVLKSLKTPMEDETLIHSKHSPATLITDDASQTVQAIQARSIFNDMWGRIKGPLQQIGKQTVLGLGAIAAKAIEQAAQTAVGRKREISGARSDHTWEDLLDTRLPQDARSLLEILNTADIRDGEEQTAGIDFYKRNIFEALFRNIQGPLQLAGEKTVQSLVGILLKDIQQGGAFIGKRHVSGDVSQDSSIAETAEQASQEVAANVMDIIVETLINAFGKRKRNVFNDIWNKARGPLEQIGRQTAAVVVATVADLVQEALDDGTGMRDSWTQTWDSMETPLEATRNQMGRILQDAVGTRLTNTEGKRDVLAEKDLKGPLTSVTNIANAVMDDVKHNIPTLELKNFKQLITSKLLSMAEEYTNRSFPRTDDIKTDGDRRIPH
ncbi:uncharacterized protein LOC121368787 [Gigantopelta aegis]|uniref:uncharacterized protein LOC121368787 n=1 Tax=Gigantopelta aegis TaxID=1735272 RepID=UPI001B88AB89|nr:uncharacterized protein LOC121368787 [Gigantopelta aegis]